MSNIGTLVLRVTIMLRRICMPLLFHYASENSLNLSKKTIGDSENIHIVSNEKLCKSVRYTLVNYRCCCAEINVRSCIIIGRYY